MIFGHFLLGHPALAQVVALIELCEAMKRWASSVSDISSENRATGSSYFSAAFSAMFVTRARLAHATAGPRG